MNEDEIKTIIYAELKRIAPDTEPQELKPDEIYRDVLDIDSFDALQFIVAMDEKLGINIPEADYGKITTLHNLLTYIVSQNKA
jgi:acyl carrier protein